MFISSHEIRSGDESETLMIAGGSANPKSLAFLALPALLIFL
jgi:hypothetical protein